MPTLSLGYRRGTLILTDRGECAIETLRIDDRVITASGTPRPLRWISQRSFSGRFAAGNREVLPVVVRQGALSDGMPRRDLWVSPHHALYIDDRLVEARALVNGVSIQQPASVEEVTYCHLELDSHDVIHAEGTPAESCLDDEGGPKFAGLSPLAEDDGEDEVLDALWRRLATRAGAVPVRGEGQPRWRGQLDLVGRERIEGWVCDDEHPHRPVRVRIVVNGTPLDEVVADEYRADLEVAGVGSGRHAFSFLVPGGFATDQRHLVDVLRADSGEPLPGSPQVLEAAATSMLVASAPAPASWQGALDVVSRTRIEGWAWQSDQPQTPLSLVISSNGEPVARVLANRYRQDLENAGIGDGRHAFSMIIPGGLSPLARHVIQIVGEADGCEMPGSPVTLEAATGFDAALEHTIRRAVAGLALPAERERVLAFFAEQTERLLQDTADVDAHREARLLRRRHERRWGRDAAIATSAPATGRRALVIDDQVPTPGRDAGSTAILSHMRALQLLDYEVTFVAAEQLSPPHEAAEALQALGILCCRVPYYATVEEVLCRQADGFDVIYLHRVSNAAKYLALARRYCPKGRILYSVADLHNVRVARQTKIEARPELLALSRRLRLAECTASCSANAVITHSTTEAKWLQQAVTGCNVHVVPWHVPVQSSARAWVERSGIAFIGNFSHAPNVDAARFLAEQVMPRVRKVDPTIDCLIVGSHMTPAVERLSAPGIVVRGYVPDLADVYAQVRLTVAPLRYGAGVKGKVLESLAAGVPCVMTPMAAEGIDLPPALMRLIAIDEARLADFIVRWHGSETDCGMLGAAGQAFVAAACSEQRVVDGLRAAIEGRLAAVMPTVAAVANGIVSATGVPP